MTRLGQAGDRLRRARHAGCRPPGVELPRPVLRLDRAVVIDLAAGVGEVARLGERLRQRDVILRCLHVADAGRQPVDAGGRGPQAGQQAGAGRIAQRRLAMRVGEQRAALGQPVDVRRPDLRMPAQAADPVVLVVDRDEQDVGPGGGGGRHAGACQTHVEGQQASSSEEAEQGGRGPHLVTPERSGSRSRHS